MLSCFRMLIKIPKTLCVAESKFPMMQVSKLIQYVSYTRGNYCHQTKTNRSWLDSVWLISPNYIDPMVLDNIHLWYKLLCIISSNVQVQLDIEVSILSSKLSYYSLVFYNTHCLKVLPQVYCKMCDTARFTQMNMAQNNNKMYITVCNRKHYSKLCAENKLTYEQHCWVGVVCLWVVGLYWQRRCETSMHHYSIWVQGC